MNTAGPRPPPHRPLARGRQFLLLRLDLLLLRLDLLQVARVATGSLHRAGCPDQTPDPACDPLPGQPRPPHAGADALEASVGERFGIVAVGAARRPRQVAGRGPRAVDGNRSTGRTILADVGGPLTTLAGPQRSTASTLRGLAGKVAHSNRARLSPGEQRARAATLERHASELLDLAVDRVGKPEVLRALDRVWTSQPGTGRKLRMALGALFRHARAAGLIEVDPVAAVAGALVPQPAVRQHMRSVLHADALAAMQRIEMCRATLAAKACLRFQILTAARPSEARLATWGEIAEDARMWYRWFPRPWRCSARCGRCAGTTATKHWFSESAGGGRLVVGGDRGRGHEVGRSRRRGVASRLALDVPHMGIGASGRRLRGDANESVACGRLGCRTQLFGVDVSGQAPGTARRMVGVPCRRRRSPGSDSRFGRDDG